jgi:hypothetical protein
VNNFAILKSEFRRSHLSAKQRNVEIAKRKMEFSIRGRPGNGNAVAASHENTEREG